MCMRIGSATPTIPVATLENPSPPSMTALAGQWRSHGTRVLVGAYQDDTLSTDSGIAYGYDLTGGTPTTPSVTIKDSGPRQGDQFRLFGSRLGHIMRWSAHESRTPERQTRGARMFMRWIVSYPQSRS
jgi:hypothetical protein